MHGHCDIRRISRRQMGRRTASPRPLRRLRIWRRHGGGGFGGKGGEDMMRARRMLAQGDLRLIALALIAEAPRHGYEIIKLLEEKTGDWYSPSPGIVYPTLTYLEEADYVTASTEGAKSSTPSPTKAAPISTAIANSSTSCWTLAALGERVSRWRRDIARRARKSPHPAASGGSGARSLARNGRQASRQRCRGRSATCRNHRPHATELQQRARARQRGGATKQSSP